MNTRIYFGQKDWCPFCAQSHVSIECPYSTKAQRSKVLELQAACTCYFELCESCARAAAK